MPLPSPHREHSCLCSEEQGGNVHPPEVWGTEGQRNISVTSSAVQELRVQGAGGPGLRFTWHRLEGASTQDTLTLTPVASLSPRAPGVPSLTNKIPRPH